MAQTWGTGINNKQFMVNAANNRLGVPSGQSGTMSYDAAGNLITDTYTGAGAREYDAENKMTKAWGGKHLDRFDFDSTPVAGGIVSRIHGGKRLVKLAEQAGASVQKGIDQLTSQLAKGNFNPGLGTKNLFGNISYARASDGARVFFRK